jgi:hypothetical protein
MCGTEGLGAMNPCDNLHLLFAGAEDIVLLCLDGCLGCELGVARRVG